MGKQPLEQTDLLLFSKEWGKRPDLYVLYFAQFSTLQSARPEILRYTIASKKAWKAFSVGSIYTLQLNGTRITQANLTDQFQMTDDLFFQLCDTRDLLYMDDAAAKHLGILDAHYHPKNVYYSFAVYKGLIEFRPTLGHRLLAGFIRYATYFLSFLFPILLYLLFLYFSASFMQIGIGLAKLFAIPLLALGALPFTFWAMHCLSLLTENLLLNLNFTSTDLLQSYALKWAGIRKNCRLPNAERQKMIHQGYIVLSILAVSVVIGFFIL